MRIPRRRGHEDAPAIIDLFSGVGGLSLGAARAGFAVVCAVERDKRAKAAHKLNFPQSVHLQRDVSRLAGIQVLESIGARPGEIAGVIGGPPCQGFSTIGRNDAKDPRNRLFVHFFRIVSEVKPLFFMAENVPGVLRETHEHLRQLAMKPLEKEYEILQPITVCASDYGAPTTRTRVLFIGYRKNRIDHLTSDDFNAPNNPATPTVHEALQGLPQRIDPAWQSEESGWRVATAAGSGYFALRLQNKIPQNVGAPTALERLRREKRVSGCLGTIHTSDVIRRFALVEPGARDSISKATRLDPDGYCPTIRAGTGSDRGSYQAVRPLHPTQNRVITPREAARLQGFPDWFQFSPTKWHSFRQIGNSVSPILAERLLGAIHRRLSNHKAEVRV